VAPAQRPQRQPVRGGALNLNVHFHCIIPDTVFVREDGQVRFVGLAPPCDDAVMAVLRRIVARLEPLLRPRLAATDGDARPLDALAAARAEALHFPGPSRHLADASWLLPHGARPRRIGRQHHPRPGASVGDSAMLALEVRGRPVVMDQQPWHAS
jgi:hypothetical protein